MLFNKTISNGFLERSEFPLFYDSGISLMTGFRKFLNLAEFYICWFTFLAKGLKGLQLSLLTELDYDKGSGYYCSICDIILLLTSILC